jgi:2-polyprenyl-6-methoxyphenol hydroxylase-like FAD-dependent oxidoreductase
MISDYGFHALIADGKIKTVKDASPAGISKDGRSLMLEDGRELEADVIIAATGFGSTMGFLRESYFRSTSPRG